MGPISFIKKPQWGWILVFSSIVLGLSACGGKGVQSFTLKAQFASETSPEGSSQLNTSKNQIINQCQVSCETALLTGEDTDLLQLPTSHVVDCDENQLPVNGSEITIVEGVSLKTQDEFLTVQVCCNPLATGNILNDIDLFNFLAFCGELTFAPGSCSGGCELDVGLDATSAEDVASLGCFVINTAMLALSPFIEEEGDNNITCTLFSLLQTGALLAECAPPPESLQGFCVGGGDDGGNLSEEVCDNEIDDDSDGAIDCEDSDCLESPDCSEGGNSCGNLVCDSCEDAGVCSFDCGPSGTCGDGTCGLGENHDLCPEDCILDIIVACFLPLGPSCMEANCDCESVVGSGSICDGNCCTPIPDCGNGYHDQHIGEECDFISGKLGTEPVGCDINAGEKCVAIGLPDECTCVLPNPVP